MITINYLHYPTMVHVKWDDFPWIYLYINKHTVTLRFHDSEYANKYCGGFQDSREISRPRKNDAEPVLESQSRKTFSPRKTARNIEHGYSWQGRSPSTTAIKMCISSSAMKFQGLEFANRASRELAEKMSGANWSVQSKGGRHNFAVRAFTCSSQRSFAFNFC